MDDSHARADDVTRVMLVDDHEVVRAGLRNLLGAQDDLEVVAEADNAADAVLRARSYHPDVVVLDVRLPDRSGVEVCREIRDEHPGMAVLMLTSYADDKALFDSIMAGAWRSITMRCACRISSFGSTRPRRAARQVWRWVPGGRASRPISCSTA
jgi:CheY-like chemotaxis protein